MIWKILRYGSTAQGAREDDQRGKGDTGELREHLNLLEVEQLALVDGVGNSFWARAGRRRCKPTLFPGPMKSPKNPFGRGWNADRVGWPAPAARRA
jgi:hypothetical protein